MTRFFLNTALALTLVALSALVWLGQQKPPDRYLERIRQSGTLRVGIDPTYPPFDMLREGRVAGYDAALAEGIARDLGVKVEFRTLALDTLYDSLIAGNVDMLVSALPPIPERQGDVRYSVPYYQSGQVLVVRAGDNAVSSVGTLDGRKVGVELGSNADTEARRLQRSTTPGMQLQSTYHSPEEALDALVSGEVDAAITDNTSAQTYLATHPGSVTILSPPLTNEPFVVAVPARADALAGSVNATIERLRNSGELARIMGQLPR
ncbi:MAG: ABC transporter substrate-binding protein [Chloroflexota bacterium]|nr:ABC transporter substrate-binding protein [Chloroflexota bacterium]MDQ5864677.1 ABC transporter substrate-binding protein [Chloroflexota bacterium]